MYKTVQPPNGQALQKMIVKPEVKMTILAWISHLLDRIDTRVANQKWTLGMARPLSFVPSSFALFSGISSSLS